MNSGHSIEFGRIDPQTSVTTANTTLNMEDTVSVYKQQESGEWESVNVYK